MNPDTRTSSLNNDTKMNNTDTVEIGRALELDANIEELLSGKSVVDPVQAPVEDKPSDVTDGTSATPPADAKEVTETPQGGGAAAKVKLLPDAIYELEDGRELNGKDLAGEMMLKQQYTFKVNELKKLEEQASARIAEADKVIGWVELMADDPIAPLYLQARGKKIPVEKALEFAMQAAGIKKDDPTEDPRITRFKTMEPGDDGYQDALVAFTQATAEAARTEALEKARAEFAAREAEKKETQTAVSKEEQAKRDIVEHNRTMFGQMDVMLAERLGVSEVTEEIRKEWYPKIVKAAAENDIVINQETYQSQKFSKSDIKVALTEAVPKRQSPKTQPPPPADNSPQLPLSAGGQSHATAPMVVEQPQIKSSSEELEDELEEIIAKAK